ncbi:hypothetical protein WEH80_26630 [Actinomycetes bacterium KLBMP 9759]
MSTTMRRSAVSLSTLAVVLVSGVALAPSALAGVCQTCEPAPPGNEGGGGGQPQNPVHRVTVEKIEVQDISDDDYDAHDEIYVTMDGEKVWGAVSMRNGQIAYPGVSRGFVGGTGSALTTLRFYDRDDISADDLLGSFTIYGNGLTVGRSTSIGRWADGGSFIFTWRVQKIN